MNSNILDYMYEGYGYDTDNQLLYVDVENYEEALTEDTKMTTAGMATLAHQGIITHDPRIPTEEDNKYKEVPSFISESGAKYTDLRKPLCGCCNTTGSTQSSPVTDLGAGESFTNGD
jgi:hypothetical protein